jgi:PAS domain S-box-containing protein
MGASTFWLERAVDHLDIALLLVAPDRHISYANAAAYRLFGLRPGQFEGATLDRLTTPERRGELRNIDEVLGGGGARKVRSVVRREDGARVDVTMIVEPCFDEQSRVVAASVRYEGIVHLGRPSLMPRQTPTTAPPASRSSMPPAERAAAFGQPPTSGAQGFGSQAASSHDAGRASDTARAHDGARASAVRLNGLPDLHVLAAQLERALRHQRWLEERLSVPPSVAPLDDASERARAMLAVSESRRLTQEVLGALEGEASAKVVP